MNRFCEKTRDWFWFSWNYNIIQGFLIVIAILGFIFAIAFISAIQEISNDEYKYLEYQVEQNPAIKKKVRQYMEDGKINKTEFSIIQDEIDNADKPKIIDKLNKAIEK